MAFDGNPQAVFHGEGYGELEMIGNPTFNISSSDSLTVSASNTFHIATHTEKGQMIGLKTSGGTGGDLNKEIHWINVDDIPADPTTVGATPDADNSAIWVDHSGATAVDMAIARGASGNAILASGAHSSLGGTGLVLEIYKLK